MSYLDVTIFIENGSDDVVPCFGFLTGQVPTALKSFSKEEEEEEGRLKRKREDDVCDGKPGEEEEIKKVCKEGFQLFCHNVCLLFFPPDCGIGAVDGGLWGY